LRFVSPQSAEEYGDDKIPALRRLIGSRPAIIRSMKVRPSNDGEADYFGTGAEGSFHHAQPLVLIALLTTLFALVLWQGISKPAVSIPQIQTADSVGTKS
jgi:hypothetical protein